jgi:hypothetical protein
MPIDERRRDAIATAVAGYDRAADGPLPRNTGRLLAVMLPADRSASCSLLKATTGLPVFPIGPSIAAPPAPLLRSRSSILQSLPRQRANATTSAMPGSGSSNRQPFRPA